MGQYRVATSFAASALAFALINLSHAATSQNQQPTAASAVPAPSSASSPAAKPADHPSSVSAPSSGAMPSVGKAPPKAIKKVDLNNATLQELKTLPTVTDEYAKKIIANRPYNAKGELVTKAKLPEGVYFAVRHHVEMQPPRKPAAKK